MIGIDLGTTNSCVAYWDGRSARVIANRDGARITPSVVAFDEQGKTHVGAPAQRQAVANPKNTVFGAKRLIGRKHNTPELAEWTTTVPFKLSAAENGDARINVGGRARSPEEISAIVLMEMKAIAEDVLGTAVTSATITVPAYFNDHQRQATKDAGTIAGLRVENILNEPTAAALGYGLSTAGDSTFAVFDLGGGTFDISILRKTGDVFEVLATAGDTFLGGNDFDSRIVRYLVEKLRASTGQETQIDRSILMRLNEAAEQAKCQLSSLESTAVNLPFLGGGAKGPLHLMIDRFPRAVLERLCGDLLKRLDKPCLSALEQARIDAKDLDQVLLVGGMTRMPAVRERVKEIFGVPVRTDVNPDEIVAQGAACQCAILSGAIDDVALLDVTPYALGVGVLDGRMSVVIPKSCAIPTTSIKRFATTKDAQREVRIDVYQGDSEHIATNTKLGSFVLEGLPVKPAGHVELDVRFDIDADGIMNVSAKETMTGAETAIRIHPTGGLRSADVQRLRAEHTKPASAATRPAR
jgi:molecular chaperone DnaK